ncbi:hypothetical protein SAMN05428945_0957 [Streptomyces sp. 2224.1]|uniref:hypothetical protein n=1 Tax=unclassified Streptomyces TaxID=2593676 RepID=UPI000884144A|nr:MULTISPECIES: hypothetical protein [unclassified Streptomyces]PBC84432.1 hypothetical protein BX261_4420 [Streptomyces sp. 2321.6]SDR30887.1 hypothetical protein SAMN05216511_2781 [Streptomyces sp. KS_16]SEB71690.1 hypothetical protein SAMN05428945_0957 [Streptomyces sp. 2224.1]SED31154.1 hypothetical protein SAMN05428940_4447 [Streptomyces sp. 2133.1]SEE52766.1 hypothetical protein SAMN05428954_2881 [Streptomyces sp. 2112.3]
MAISGSRPASAAPSVMQECKACQDLERGRKQAAAARDRSKVTDFDVLIERHRARHQQ